jgi:lipoprotein-anchoring transpeptidase ErfK/SrfK
MKKLFSLTAIALCVAWLGTAPADAASIVAKVSLSSQTMTVMHGGKVRYVWPVSTARAGKVTPTGSWSAKYLKRHHRSSRYNNAPMPYSIFYSGNFAVHGTNAVSRLGSPASAGCIRLSRSNAATLFAMVQRAGVRSTRIVVER